MDLRIYVSVYAAPPCAFLRGNAYPHTTIPSLHISTLSHQLCVLFTHTPPIASPNVCGASIDGSTAR
eukprot:1863546-Rhodomonas_salina.1